MSLLNYFSRIGRHVHENKVCDCPAARPPCRATNAPTSGR